VAHVRRPAARSLSHDFRKFLYSRVDTVLSYTPNSRSYHSFPRHLQNLQRLQNYRFDDVVVRRHLGCGATILEGKMVCFSLQTSERYLGAESYYPKWRCEYFGMWSQDSKQYYHLGSIIIIAITFIVDNFWCYVEGNGPYILCGLRKEISQATPY
jgi:hypothetical protein